MSDILSPSEITELVCTRISHDLIGNIGAVANAVEMIDEDDADCLADIKPILDISSQTLSARLKFFRLAFGLTNTTLNNVSDIESIATEYIQTIGGKSSPIVLKTSIKTPQLYKIILLGIMILGDVFIRGGELTVSESNTGLELNADASSPLSTTKLQTIANVIGGAIPKENPAQSAPLIYLQSLLAASPVKLNLKFTETSAVLQIG